jgi:uncharacterized protein
MKLSVLDIPKDGLNFSFSSQDTWFRDVIKNSLNKIYLKDSVAIAHVEVSKADEEVFINGDFKIPYQTVCDRCLENISGSIDEKFTMTLVPALEVEAEEDEKELEKVDLEFGYYKDEEVDIGEILREEIILSIPVKFLCSKNCKGLCTGCGINLNQGSCTCPKLVDPRWAPLEKFRK